MARKIIFFLPVSMLIHDVLESKGKEIGRRHPLAPMISALLWNCEHNSNPAEDRGKQAAPLWLSSYKRVFYTSNQHVV